MGDWTGMAGFGGVCSEELSWRTFERFRELIYREAGIHMRSSKRVMLSNRLRKRVSALGMRSYDEYYRYLVGGGRQSRQELVRFLDAVSTNETYFYRGENQFKAMKELILPELMSRGEKLKVWSAGCSSGEEPYSISMVVDDVAQKLGWSGEVRVVGTDISAEVIERARQGYYSGRTLRFVPGGWLGRYFEPAGEERYRVVSRIRRRVSFRVHNLLREEPPGKGFEMIFCRNVMIYFDRRTQVELVDSRFAKVLKRDGYLFIGHSESLIGQSECFRYASINRAPIYRLEPKQGGSG